MRLLPDSIRGRVTTLVLAVALPLLAVLGWGFFDEVNRRQSEARDLALRIARSVAADIRDSTARAQALLVRLAQRPAVQSANPKNCDSLFAIVDFFPQYPNLLLYDLSGRLICSATPAPADVPYSAAAEPAISRAIPSRVSSNEPLLVLAKNRWVSVVFQPVMAHGRIVAMLALMQYLDLDTDAYPPLTVITISHTVDRRILARSREAEKWVGKVGNPTAANRIVRTQAEGRIESVGIDGVHRQYGFKKLPGIPWTVFVGLPSSAAMASVRALLVRGTIVGVLIIAVVGLLAIRITRTIERPLSVLTKTVKRAAEPGTTEQVPIEGPREVQVVAEAFNEMVRSRSAAEAQMEALSEKLLEVQEEERSRIAREIHDELGQLLTALKMDIGGFLSSSAELTAEQHAMARRIRHALAQTLSSVQRIAAELRPAILDDFGLVAAIESELETFEHRTGIECDLSAPPNLRPLGSDVDAAIYRIVQEAMTNVARHSNATRVEVRLRMRDDELFVEVRDDGRGISEEALHDRGSIGLVGMRERARRIGGRLDIEGVPEHGTIVLLRVPVARELERAQA